MSRCPGPEQRVAGAQGLDEAGRRSWIAYVGPFLFPWGEAGSRRVHGLARALVHKGYTVVVGSGADTALRIDVLERNGEAELRHIGLCELPLEGERFLQRAMKYLVAQGARTVRWLDGQPTKPSHVIVYGGYAPFMARLRPWCRSHQVPLVADVVEWYDPTHLKGGRWGPLALSTNIALRVQYPKCDGVIAISSYLEAHYRRLGVRTIRIPPTLDVLARQPERGAYKRNEPVSLIYAGTPGKKDLLPAIIRGLRLVDSSGTRVRLRVVGVTPDTVARLMGPGEALPSSVTIVGRLPQQEVSREYRIADFSVLLRTPARSAHAGFPTKVAESLAAGVPVVCNVTSDIAEYVHDGVEGFHCESATPDDFASALERALAMSPESRSSMRAAARLSAEQSFDFRVHADRLVGFLVEMACAPPRHC